MVVPTDGSGDLDESHSCFCQSASHDALPTEAISRQSQTDTVQLEDRLRLGLHVEHLGNFALHAKRQFERFDGPFNFGVIRVAFEFVQIQAAHQIELRPLLVSR